MASFQFFSTIALPTSRPHHRRCVRSAAATNMTPPPPPPPSRVEPSRLDPRVEKTSEGYWVLKEQYRKGLNPQEKLKLEKEPMELFMNMEGGIRKLSSIPFDEIDSSKLLKADIDTRLKWLGLFHRRKHQCQ